MSACRSITRKIRWSEGRERAMRAIARTRSDRPGATPSIWRRLQVDAAGEIARLALPGNFTGNFAILGLCEPILMRKTPVLQPVLEQFPTQTNRENILRNREFLASNREFSLQTDKR